MRLNFYEGSTFQFNNIEFTGNFSSCLDYLIGLDDKKAIEDAIESSRFEAYDYFLSQKPDNKNFIEALLKTIPEAIYFILDNPSQWLENNPRYLDSIALKHIEDNIPLPQNIIDLILERTIKERNYFIDLSHLKIGKGYADTLCIYLEHLPICFLKELGDRDRDLFKSLMLKPLRGLSGIERSENLNLLQRRYFSGNLEDSCYLLMHYMPEILDMKEYIFGYVKNTNLLEYVLRDATSKYVYSKVAPLKTFFEALDNTSQDLYVACLFASMRFEDIDKKLAIDALSVVPLEKINPMREEYLKRLTPDIQAQVDSLILSKKLDSSLTKHLESQDIKKI